MLSILLRLSFLCALSIYHSGADPSILNDLILPSDHPDIMTSSVNIEHVGKQIPAVCTVHLAITE